MATNWRTLGDTTLAVYKSEFKRRNSPLLSEVESIYNAVKGHSLLYLAQVGMESEYATTGFAAGTPSAHNALGTKVRGQNRYQTFASWTDGAKEWRARILDPTYAYAKTVTLADYVHVYAPSSDGNNEAAYVAYIESCVKKFGGTPTTTTTPKPTGGTTVPTSTTYAPVKVKQDLKDAIGKNLVVRNADGVFFPVNLDITAVRTTPRLQEPSDTAKRIGGDLNKGDSAHADWAWVDAAGKLWLYSNWNTVFKGEDFVPKGAPITLPDPDPLSETPSEPSNPSEITAATYKLVGDPSTLLPPIVWKGTSNFFANRSGAGDPIAIIYHCTDDLVLDNTISWFQNGSSNASSHFVIARDGTVYQFVSSKDGAWTNGDYNNPRTDLAWLNNAIASGVNVNNRTISYEFVATPSTPPTEAQYQSAIALSRYFCHPKVYGINPNRSNQCRHADINSVSRSYCPGPNFDLERIIKALGGDPAKVA